MFNIKMRFETKIKVKAVSKSVEEMFNMCSFSREDIPYTLHTVEHNMELTNSPIIPDSNWTKQASEIIFGEMVQTFTNDNKLNAEVLGTKFVGYTEIEQA